METEERYATCPKCGGKAPVTIEPDEKPDGTILGYAEATCPDCGHGLTEEEIYVD